MPYRRRPPFVLLLVSLFLLRCASGACPSDWSAIGPSEDISHMDVSCFKAANVTEYSKLPGRACTFLTGPQMTVVSSRESCALLSVSCVGNISTVKAIPPDCCAQWTAEHFAALGRRIGLLPLVCFRAMTAKQFSMVTQCQEIPAGSVMTMCNGHMEETRLSACRGMSGQCLAWLPTLDFKAFTPLCVSMWQNSSVAALDAARVSALGSVVSALTAENVGCLGRSCSGLSAGQFVPLSFSLGRSGCGRLSLECGSAMAGPTLARVSGDCFSGLSPEFLGAVSEEAVRLIPESTMRLASSKQLEGMAVKCSFLSEGQIKALGSEEVCWEFPAACLLSVQPALFGHWPAECVRRWPAGRIESLKLESLVELSEQVFSSFDVRLWSALLYKHRGALLSSLPKAKLASMRTEACHQRISELVAEGIIERSHVVCGVEGAVALPRSWIELSTSQDDLSCLGESHTQELNESVLWGMRCEQVPHLRATALGGCMDRLPDSAVRCMTKSQMAAIEPSVFSSASAKWPSLSTSAASAITPAQVVAGYDLFWPCSVVSQLSAQSRKTLICQGHSSKSHRVLYGPCVPSTKCPIPTSSIVGLTVLGALLVCGLLAGLVPLLRAAFRPRGIPVPDADVQDLRLLSM